MKIKVQINYYIPLSLYIIIENNYVPKENMISKTSLVNTYINIHSWYTHIAHVSKSQMKLICMQCNAMQHANVVSVDNEL